MKSILTVFLWLSWVVCASTSPTRERPNILLLITDQQAIDAMSCAGNPDVKTPNLDRLAARGVRFEKSYCTYPLCCPSRGSLFTSRTPHELGIYANTDAELAGKHVPTMGELFQAAGYQTAYAGKWHLSVPFPAFKGKQMPGFEVLPLAGRDPHTLADEKDAKGLTVDPNTADAAIKFLHRPHEKPFLLVVSVLNPHDICEYPECEALRKLLPADSSQLPPLKPNHRDLEKLPSALQRAIAQHASWSEKQWREYLWVYDRLTETADAEVGRVLAALEQSASKSNTIVVFTADHGEMMGSHGLVTKQKLYEQAAAVPLIIATPDCKAVTNQQHLVSGLDIMPTLLDYANITTPDSLQGKSLRPIVEGKQVTWRDFVVSEVNGGGIEARMVRTARYKYIVYAQGEHREQLFDMEKDPIELHNLMADPALADEVARHRDLLAQWRKQTHDEIGKSAPIKKNPKAGKSATGKDSNLASSRDANFTRKDANRDGNLDHDEFLTNQNDPESAKKRFEKWDANHDGLLSREEFVNQGGKTK